MSFSLNELPKIKRQTKIRVGRGIGSSKGKTSGRGVKGQKARTGHHSVKGFEGGQTPVHMRLPKKGFVNNLKKNIEVINIQDILKLINSGKLVQKMTVTKDNLFENGLIKNKKSIVKLIMGKNPIDIKDIKISVDKYSKKANKFA
ncbi:MAG: 50S ribosomal protein L15 [Proteobacteria bacterium]|nr:50S ribosomal protein L15 [Pseudomonadota bacterium]NCA27772.1 50S ribosomal protein L15 [Pseudomonadota bacterium]